MPSPLIRTSPLISVFKEDNSIVTLHHVSGKKHKITGDVNQLLIALIEPQPMKRMIDIFQNKYSEVEMSKVITELINKEIIVSELDCGFYVLKPNQRIFGFPEFEPIDGLEKSVVFLGVPCGTGNHTDNRCKDFPAAIRQYIRASNIQLLKGQNYRDFKSIDAKTNFSNLLEGIEKGKYCDWGDLYFSRGESLASTHAKIFNAQARLIDIGCIPFLLGGDHSISLPAIKCVGEKFKKIRILHFDAHHDMYSTGLDSLNEDFAPHHGNFMIKCLEYDHVHEIIQIGIRGLVNLKKPIHKKQKIKYASYLKSDAYEIARDISDGLPLYITFDIDFFNPSVAPATATPVPGGLDFADTCDLLKIILSGKEIVGIDLVELNPFRDPERITAQIALQLMLVLLNYVN